MFSSRLGFWSLDLGNGEVTCDRVAAGIFGVVGSCRWPIAQLLARFDAPGRHRVLRAAVESVRSARGFDITVCIETPHRPKVIRVIGGRGYRLDCPGPELHGVVEQVDERGQDPDLTVLGDL